MNALDETALRAERSRAELAAALGKWYASHSSIRRLWAIEDSISMRILLALEPTADGADTLPIWLANSRTWANDLRVLAGREVQLQPLSSDTLVESRIHSDAATIVNVCWRDSWTTP